MWSSLDKVERTLVFLMALVMIIGLSSLTSAGLGTFEKNTCMEIRTILNTSAVSLSSLSYPNNTVIYPNDLMTKNGNTFNYTFCDTEVLGRYIYDYNDSEGYVYVNDFEVTYNGEKVSSSNTILSIVFLLLAAGLLALGWSFSKEHWILKTFFNFSAVGLGILAINSARIIANESSNLDKMSSTGLMIMIVIFSIFFLYIFVYAFIEVIKMFKEKRGVRWNYD